MYAFKSIDAPPAKPENLFVHRINKLKKHLKDNTYRAYMRSMCTLNVDLGILLDHYSGKLVFANGRSVTGIECLRIAVSKEVMKAYREIKINLDGNPVHDESPDHWVLRVSADSGDPVIVDVSAAQFGFVEWNVATGSCPMAMRADYLKETLKGAKTLESVSGKQLLADTIVTQFVSGSTAYLQMLDRLMTVAKKHGIKLVC